MTNFTQETAIATLEATLIFDERTEDVVIDISVNDYVGDSSDVEGLLLDGFEAKTGINYWESDLILEEVKIKDALIGDDIHAQNVTIDQVAEVLAAIEVHGEEIALGYINDVHHNDIRNFNETILANEFIGVYHSDRDFIEQTSESYGIPVDSYDLDKSDLRHDHWTIAITGGVAAFTHS